MSRTTNPEDIENLVNEVADATTTEMVKQGLLARQSRPPNILRSDVKTLISGFGNGHRVIE